MINVLVVGAGITGLSIAENLRKRGAKVVLIDRVLPGSEDQASFGNAGVLARCAIAPINSPGFIRKIPNFLFGSDSPVFIKWRYLPKLLPWIIPFLQNSKKKRFSSIVNSIDSLTHDSIDMHLSLTKGTKAEGYIKTGNYAWLYNSETSFKHDLPGHRIRDDYGYKHEFLNRSEITDFDPNIGSKFVRAALYSDHAWISNPGQYVKAIYENFLSHGGKFCQNEVIGLDNRSLKLNDGSILTGDKVILAAGAWSESLAKLVEVKTQIESERGYHLFLADTNIKPTCPYMLVDSKFVVTPMEGGVRCAGLLELGGLSANASEAPIRFLKKKIKELYPDLTFEEQTSWLGHRPSTPDNLPLIGKSANYPNVILACGSQHLGLTIGPKIGKLVSDIVFDVPVNINLKPFQADRFS